MQDLTAEVIKVEEHLSTLGGVVDGLPLKGQ